MSANCEETDVDDGEMEWIVLRLSSVSLFWTTVFGIAGSLSQSLIEPNCLRINICEVIN